jgi:hypothetical protein
MKLKKRVSRGGCRDYVCCEEEGARSVSTREEKTLTFQNIRKRFLLGVDTFLWF